MEDTFTWSVRDNGVNFGAETNNEYDDQYVEGTDKYTQHLHFNRGQLENPDRPTH